MQIEHVASDFLIAIGETYGANSTILLNGSEALLVDGMASVADATELRTFIEQELGARVRFIISTHYFSDHMAALKLFPEATIVAHELYAHTFGSEQHRSDEEAAHFVEPTMVIGDRMRLRWGRFTLDIFHNPGHTMSTLNIDVPEEDVLFASDTVVGNIVYLAYGAPALFERALDRLEQRGRSRLITSHGGVGSSEAIRNARHYLRNVRPGSTLEECLPAGVQGSDFERIFHERNVGRALQPAP